MLSEFFFNVVAGPAGSLGITVQCNKLNVTFARTKASLVSQPGIENQELQFVSVQAACSSAVAELEEKAVTSPTSARVAEEPHHPEPSRAPRKKLARALRTSSEVRGIPTSKLAKLVSTLEQEPATRLSKDALLDVLQHAEADLADTEQVLVELERAAANHSGSKETDDPMTICGNKLEQVAQWLIAVLKQNSASRSELSTKFGLNRRRISTALSIIKGLGLIRELEEGTKPKILSYNLRQEIVLSNYQQFANLYLRLKASRLQLQSHYRSIMKTRNQDKESAVPCPPPTIRGETARENFPQACVSFAHPIDEREFDQQQSFLAMLTDTKEDSKQDPVKLEDDPPRTSPPLAASDSNNSQPVDLDLLYALSTAYEELVATNHLVPCKKESQDEEDDHVKELDLFSEEPMASGRVFPKFESAEDLNAAMRLGQVPCEE